MKILATLLFAGKLGKFLITGGTMLLSVFAYALFFGWRYAVGLVILIFIHEMGHFMAARQCGLKVGAPTFIPFLGAWIDLKEQPMNAETEAFVGLAGPMLGSLGAFVFYMIGKSTGSAMWMALAYAGFVINLFNLLPLSPLDGGRIVSVVSPKIWLLGVPLLAALFFWHPSPLLILVAIMAAPQIWAVLTNKDMPNARYYQAPAKVRITYAVHYLVLAVLLSVLAFDVYQGLPNAF